jgi:hypothetical protein
MSWMTDDRGPSWWAAAIAGVLALLAPAGIGQDSGDAGHADSARAEQAVSSNTTDAAKTRKKVRVVLRAGQFTSDQLPSKVTVVVKSGTKHAAGSVSVVSSGKVLSRGKVTAGKTSRTKLTLPSLSVGEHRLRAVYRPRGAPAKYRSAGVLVKTIRGCAADPSACGFPDAGTTGPRRSVTLRDVPGQVTSGPGWHYDSRGWIEVDGDDALVSGIRADVGLNIEADGVTVRDVALTVSGEDFGIALRHVNGVLIEHSSITAPAASGPQRLMVGIKDIYADSSGIRISRNDISRTATGIQLESGTVEKNYIHDLGYTDGDHVNGTTSNGGSQLLILRGNTIFNPHDQTDAISLFQDFGGQANRQIIGNLLAGGGYTIYAGAGPGKAATSGIVVRDNRIARLFYSRGGYFGPGTAYSSGAGNEWSGNVWDDSSRPIPAP